MKTITIHILLFALLLQIGCLGALEICLPIETNKNENELKSLNYFGERKLSTIYLVDSTEI
jgi:hypothetical protein